MADTISVVVTGDREVALKFDQFPQNLRQRLKDVITAKGQTLAARERALAPSRTGRLRSEIQFRLIEKPEAIVGEVSLNAPKGSQDFAKAGALEYGGTGEAFRVRAHEARLSNVFGRPAQLSVQVAEHTRAIHLAARRFVRDPVAEMQSEIELALEGAVDAAVAEANS